MLVLFTFLILCDAPQSGLFLLVLPELNPYLTVNLQLEVGFRPPKNSYPFIELDGHQCIRHFLSELGRKCVVRDRPAHDSAASGCFNMPDPKRMAVRTHESRVVPDLPTVLTLLKDKHPSRGAFPVRCINVDYRRLRLLRHELSPPHDGDSAVAHVSVTGDQTDFRVRHLRGSAFVTKLPH